VETDASAMAALGERVATGWTPRLKEAYETDESGQGCMWFGMTGSDCRVNVWLISDRLTPFRNLPAVLLSRFTVFVSSKLRD